MSHWWVSFVRSTEISDRSSCPRFRSKPESGTVGRRLTGTKETDLSRKNTQERPPKVTSYREISRDRRFVLGLSVERVDRPGCGISPPQKSSTYTDMDCNVNWKVSGRSVVVFRGRWETSTTVVGVELMSNFPTRPYGPRSRRRVR